MTKAPWQFEGVRILWNDGEARNSSELVLGTHENEA